MELSEDRCEDCGSDRGTMLFMGKMVCRECYERKSEHLDEQRQKEEVWSKRVRR